MHSEEKKRPHGIEAYAVNRIGHTAGRKLAAGLWKQQWIQRLASKNPDLMRIVSEGAIALTSMLEMGGDSTLARLANFIAESLSMENLELLEKFEKDPENPELAAQVEKIGQEAGAKADGNVVVAFDHIHKNKDCLPVARYIAQTTPPPRTGKGGQVFQNPSTADVVTTTMSAALDSGTPLCGRCYPALSVRKAEEPQKPKEIVPGRNFIEYVMRLKAEDAPRFETFWRCYLERLEGPDGPALAGKFQEAFNGKHSYEAFLFVVSLPPRSEHSEWEEWHVALDALLGKVTPHESLRKQIEGFISEEKRQTEEMFRALFDWLDKSNTLRDAKIADVKASIRKLDEQWIADRKARKTGKTVRKIVFLSLLAVLASWYIIQRVDSDASRSETTEQKETAHVR